MLSSALWYAQHGFYVFPIYEPDGSECSCGNLADHSKGKHPRVSNGYLDATLDKKIIRQWWTQWPDASIGIDCRRSNIFVIDNDVRKGGFASHADLKEFVTKHHGSMPDTCTILTGSNDGSSHDIYHRVWAEGETVTRDLDKAHGLEIRGAGNYIVAAPSRHVSGGTYHVDGTDGANALLKLTPAEAWLNKYVRNGGAPHTEGQTNDQAQEKKSGLWVSPETEFDFWLFALTHLKLVGTPESCEDGIRQKVLCPWWKKHTTGGNTASIIKYHDGRYGFKCHHDHCKDQHWQDVRAGYDPVYCDSSYYREYLIEKEKKKAEREKKETGESPETPLTQASAPESPSKVVPYPDPLAEEAFYGLAGELVKRIQPRTEADPVALLLHILVTVGCMIGRGPHFRVGGAQHHAVLYNVVVGPTASGKGQAKEDTNYCLRPLAEEWFTKRVKTGLSSGEGFIWHVRDPIEEQHVVKEKGRVVGYEMVVTDPGIEDKRLLVIEPEFASALRAMDREGNTLSAQLRQAWDDGNVGTLTKHKAASAKGVHAAVQAHITKEELIRYFSRTEQANGFGNRILWSCVHRSQLLPDGGELDQIDWQDIRQRFEEAITFAKTVGEVGRSEEARKIWHAVYQDLRAERTGMFGAVTGRAAPQVMRLALIYALLDKSRTIEADHLMAALAVWAYCEQSARFLFGELVGNDIADELLRVLRQHPEGMTRTDIHGFFGKNKTAEQFGQALVTLQEQGLVRMESYLAPDAKRRTERWFAT